MVRAQLGGVAGDDLFIKVRAVNCRRPVESLDSFLHQCIRVVRTQLRGVPGDDLFIKVPRYVADRPASR